MRASGETYEKNQGAAFRLNSPSQSWLGAVGLFVVVGIAYFLAARVGVVLGVSQGVPIFWPAAGIAVGAFITLGPNARLPVTVAVVAATIASGILIGRSLSLTITFAFFNTGEALLTAWLIERWFGRAFILGTVRQVLGFVVASAVSEAVAASGAGIVVHFLEPTTSSAHAWRLWFASCSLGIFTVAPLVIGLGEIVRELPPRRELIEGTVGLATLAAVSVFVISLPQSPWATALPVALVLPIVLWIAVRCRPAFAAAAMFIVALAVIWSTTFDAGHFADASIALSDRILAAQTLVLAAALLALVLAALFAERRRSEAELKQSNNRLQLALDCAELGTWNLQLGTGRFDNDVRDRHIHGHGQETPPKTLAEMRSQVHPGDLSKLDAAFRELRHACGSCRTEYRLAPRTDQEDAGRERWVTLEGTVVRRADGRPEQLLGVTRDITERKLAEEAVRTSEERLRRVSDNADVGLIRCSRDWLYLSANPAYAKIAGKPLDQIMGRPMAEVMGAEAVETIRPYVERVLRGEHVIYEAEVPYAGAGTRYMHVSYTPDTDATGQIVGWIACITDITERKRAENALRQREAELGEAQRLAHIGSWFWEAETDALVASDELLRIFGVDPATRHVLTLRDQRDRWHPVDDWERLKAAIQRTMQTGLGYELELRAFRNEVPIWITAGGAAVRNSNGQIVGLRGTVQDITQRKQAELALADRNLQLRLAEMAGLIGSYAYDSLSEIGQVSSGYAAIHGLPEGTTEIARSEWLARVHAEDVERLQLCRSEALRERREEYKVDYRIIRHDGEVRWIESRVFIMYGSDATGHRLTGVNIDVTERKRAEALYKENSTRLADALTAGQVIAFEWNSVPGLIQRSDNAIDILGRDDQDCWVGSRQNDFLNNVHPDDRTSLKTCIGELSPRSPSYAVTFRYVRPDGRTVWLEETARGEFDTTGKLSRVLGLTRDITHRKQAEQAIAERNTQLQLAGRAALVGSYVFDVKDGTMQISQGYATIHGLPEGTIETTIREWRARVHPEDLARVEGLREQAFADRRKEDNAEYRIVLSNGEVRWIERRGTVSYDQMGQPERVVGVNIDITDRKRTEERQRTLVAELDHRVKNALATVSAVVSQTRQGRRSVADFAAALEGRLRSMAATHELLSARRWSGVSLANLVLHELAPYANRNNTEINGPDVALRPEAGQAMAMVIHELATNAAKYGALSTKKGRVSIRWDRRLNGHPRSDLVLEWQEIGGPPVSTPGNSGYGTSTIRDLIPYEFDGTVDLVFAPEGVRCRLKLPADWLSDAADPYYPSSGVIAGSAAR